MTKIPIEEVSFDSTSYVDPNGRVFEWRGEVFRAINPKAAPFYMDIWERGIFQQLQDEGLLVKTERTSFCLEGYDLVLKHYKIPFLTYCIGWPAPMLKEAALLTLDINLRLAESNLTIQDAYPWNVYFDGVKPVFIDIGSIVPVDPNFIWAAYHQFCQFFLYPLHLYSIGRGKIARLLLTHYWEGVQDDDLLYEIPFSYKIRNPRIVSRIILPSLLDRIFRALPSQWRDKFNNQGRQLHNKFNTPELRVRFLHSLRKDVESIDVSSHKTHWWDYYQEKFPSFDGTNNLSPKHKTISDILDRLRPRTVLDVGCNTGRYSILAAEKGARVIAWDKDESCVSQLYYEAKEKDLYVIPLVMDFINPSPSFGWCCRQFPSSVERLRCEMVLCLALMHHLVFKQWQNFERIAEALSVFSDKWALLEFVPRDDEYVKACWHERFDWYTLENLTKSLYRHFSKIQVHDSYPEGRKLLVCEK